MPADYAQILAEIKERIKRERLRTVFSANSAMVLLYWDVGQIILERQKREGWGAKVVDRLAADLRESLPRHEGLLAAQSQVHARFRRRVAGPGNCATGHCTNCPGVRTSL